MFFPAITAESEERESENFSKILGDRNLTVAGWEEIGLKLAGHGAPRRPNPEFVNSNFQPYIWNSIFGWGGGRGTVGPVVSPFHMLSSAF